MFTRIEKMTRIGNKLTVVQRNFSMENYNVLLRKILEADAADDLFNFMESFGRLHNINDTVSIWILEDPTQKMDTYTCGLFQLFFFENLFIASENSEILTHKKLTKEQ